MPLYSTARVRTPADPTRGATIVRARPTAGCGATLVRPRPTSAPEIDDEDITTMFARDDGGFTDQPGPPLAPQPPTVVTVIAPIPAYQAPAGLRPDTPVFAPSAWAARWPPPALLDTARDVRRHQPHPAPIPPSRIVAVALVILASLSCVGGGALIARASLKAETAQP